MTWQNQPPPTSSATTVSAFTTRGQPYVKNQSSVELVGYVRAEHAAGHQVLSVLIEVYTPDIYSVMDSRESETPPSLNITFEL